MQRASSTYRDCECCRTRVAPRGFGKKPPSENERKRDFKGLHRLKTFVPVERVMNLNVKTRAKADGAGIDLSNGKMSMILFDEIAVEEAIA